MMVLLTFLFTLCCFVTLILAVVLLCEVHGEKIFPKCFIYISLPLFIVLLSIIITRIIYAY